jgi:hypothetical protein
MVETSSTERGMWPCVHIGTDKRKEATNLGICSFGSVAGLFGAFGIGTVPNIPVFANGIRGCHLQRIGGAPPVQSGHGQRRDCS